MTNQWDPNRYYHSWWVKLGVMAIKEYSTLPSLVSYSGQHGPVSWGCRIHRLHLCERVRHTQRLSWYETKQSDGEAPVMLDLWGMQSTPLLSSLPGPCWSGVVALDRVLSMGQIELNCVSWTAWNRTLFVLKWFGH